jgi:tetrahydromethanopterin S-methyltransferase subunit G
MARQMGNALIEARMAQARRCVELQTARLQARDGTTFGRDIGSRYY